MTQLVIDVVDISGGTHPDDKVRLWAPQHRADGERVVSTSPVDVTLVEGQATVDVLPGPARVQIMTQGVVDSAPKRVTIPDEASVTLRAVIEDGLEWEPEVVSRVAVLASRAELAAVRAETVADTFGSLEGVATSVQAAEAAAASAEADRVVVEQAATSASWSEDRLTVLGATSPPLTGPQGPEGPQGEKGDPGEGSGDVLWSELDTILDGKAAAAHTHTKADITDLEAVSAEWNAGGAIVKRLSSGHVSVPATPMNINNAASKYYVDNKVAQKADSSHTHSEYATTAQVEARTPEIRVVSTIPASPTPGVVYLRFG